MRAISIFLLIFINIPQFAIAQNESLSSAEQDVINAQATRIFAMIDADVDKLNDLLMDDLTYSHTTGWTETKSGYLETVKSKRVDYIKFIPKDLKVRIFGNTAIVTGKVDANLGRTDFTIKFLEVQIKQDGIWKLAAWQSVLNKVD